MTDTNERTEPASIDSALDPAPCKGAEMISPYDLAALIRSHPASDILLLDLRVYPAFAKSRIRDALNLCIPTTLLKRPTFSVQKLLETFTTSKNKAKFAGWRSVRFIVVYDAHAKSLKDAVSSVNIIRKFVQQQWCGLAYILTGGFSPFAKQYPDLLDEMPPDADTQVGQAGTPGYLGGPKSLAVAGGCMMPTTQSLAGPFFGTIRQNIELENGVGEIKVRLPENMDPMDPNRHAPRWIRALLQEGNLSKRIANRFLWIEEAEQKRMQRALAPSILYPHDRKVLVFSPKSRIAATPAPSVGATPSELATPPPRFDSPAQTTPRAAPPSKLPDIFSPTSISLAGIEKGTKNRYKDMLPYNHSRVKLANVSRGGCDYINASHIRSALSGKDYIAAQAPTPATFQDFWRVVWEQEVRFIIMLTAETEGGQIKCHRYWSNGEYGPLKLWQSDITLPPSPNNVKTRALNLSDGKSSRTIFHMHYLEWPDFGTIEPHQVLSFVQFAGSLQSKQGWGNSLVSAAQSPVLVHCSAGCGRTGTYCTIDSVLSTIQAGSYNDTEEDLIARTVEDFRVQRLSMVQTLRQFVLCYETIVEWLFGDTDEVIENSHKRKE